MSSVQGWEAEIAQEAATLLKIDMCYGDGGRIWSTALRQRPNRLVELHTPPRLPSSMVQAVRAAAVRIFKARACCWLLGGMVGRAGIGAGQDIVDGGGLRQLASQQGCTRIHWQLSCS